MNDTQATGKLGEDLALQYLLNAGLHLRARNYRYKRSEIDLIMQDGNCLVFVEVKARRGNPRFGYPEEAVADKKIEKIQEGAEAFIVEQNWLGPIRFDIVSVQLSSQEPHITYFKDAF